MGSGCLEHRHHLKHTGRVSLFPENGVGTNFTEGFLSLILSYELVLLVLKGVRFFC